ncbi:MAG: methylmalonyl-CoA epimerase [Armatimonadetes bacterium]|nr:methylmalonyl-CoA epimerase [Armatimonadota bacterium]
MRKAKLHHIGIAARDARKALEFYESGLGVTEIHWEEVPSQKVRLAGIRFGGTTLEILEPTSPDSPIARFLEKKAEGLHHLCFEVGDLEATLERLCALGYDLIDRVPREGAGNTRIAFVHPKSTGNRRIFWRIQRLTPEMRGISGHL